MLSANRGAYEDYAGGGDMSLSKPSDSANTRSPPPCSVMKTGTETPTNIGFLARSCPPAPGWFLQRGEAAAGAPVGDPRVMMTHPADREAGESRSGVSGDTEKAHGRRVQGGGCGISAERPDVVVGEEGDRCGQDLSSLLLRMKGEERGTMPNGSMEVAYAWDRYKDLEGASGQLLVTATAPPSLFNPRLPLDSTAGTRPGMSALRRTLTQASTLTLMTGVCILSQLQAEH
eukprot:GHVU01158317.1.p1 GENE.GHVU01158317.1~~GHVU01158317.1.p1  ORF type:complete len:231 (-),score=21.90 GHVU01158317.1:269-961(-)